MDFLTTVLVLCIVVQYLTNLFKTLLPEGMGDDKHKQIVLVLSALVGVLLCIVAKVDVFANLMEININPPIIAYVLSGLMLAGGSGIFHEITSLIRSNRDDIL